MLRKLALVVAVLSVGVIVSFALVWAWLLFVLGVTWMLERLP